MMMADEKEEDVINIMKVMFILQADVVKTHLITRENIGQEEALEELTICKDIINNLTHMIQTITISSSNIQIN